MTTQINQLMDESEGSLLCYRIAGKVIESEYLDFLARVKANIATYGEFRLLLLYTNFQGWEQSAAEMDVAFYVEYGKYLKKFCLIGAPDKEVMSKLIAKQMISGELRIFAAGRLAEALEWAKS